MNLQQLSIDLQWKNASDEVMDLWEKAAVDPDNPPKKLLDQLGSWINLWPGNYPGGIPNHPGTLQSLLTGGLAGGALGYGLGWLGEKILPKSWTKGRVKKTTALLGALAGLSPALMQGLASSSVGGSFWSPEIFQDREKQWDVLAGPDGKPMYAQQDGTAYGEDFWESDHADSPRLIRQQLNWSRPRKNRDYDYSIAEKASAEIRESFIKASNYGFGASPIPVDQFQDTVWNDPRVSERLPLPMQAAASGLIMGSARLPGKRQGTKFVTPMDVGRMAAGMGSGYLSGALVGKGLGLLFGMPDATQQRLKDTGMFAGVISNLVPVAFGG